MNTLRKTYLILLAIGMIVLLMLRPPMSMVGCLGLGVTVVSMVGMGALATGASSLYGRFWLGWLGVQLLTDAVAFSRETDNIWVTVGWAWGGLAALGSGLFFLPLYMALFRIGRIPADRRQPEAADP